MAKHNEILQGNTREEISQRGFLNSELKISVLWQ